MKSLELKNLNLVELSNNDALNTCGGDWKQKIWDATIGWVVGEVIDGVGRGLTKECKPCPCK
jgi:hypothetical protein